MKIRPGDEATIRAVETSVKRRKNEPDDAPDYEAHFCLPSDKYNARGFGRKVYGVCSIVRDDFARLVACVRPASWDREGRLLIMETNASGSLPKLALINIYAVNGTENPYKDPETGRVVGTRHDRKLEVHRLLQQECRKFHARGFAVVLAGDREPLCVSIQSTHADRPCGSQHRSFINRWLSQLENLPKATLLEPLGF